jgi:mannitol operon transcriptional antiterminator
LSKISMKLNSRQQQTLLIFLETSDIIKLKDISSKLGISSRTVQRELADLDEFLRQHGLCIQQKKGSGLYIHGSTAEKQSLYDYLMNHNILKIFSPEERQLQLRQLLLTNREPTKLFFFSRRFNVTDATISNDMDKIEPWFEKFGITLIRRSGLGVYIEAEEEQVREAIVYLLRQNFTHEHLLGLLAASSNRFQSRLHLDAAIRTRLLGFINPQWLLDIEEIVQESEAKWGYETIDSAYVGFVVHLALAVQRLKSGKNITMDAASLDSLKQRNEYQLALRIASLIEAKMQVVIPQSELGYIVIHLMGAGSPDCRYSADDNVEELVEQMIGIVEQQVRMKLSTDYSLRESLTTHLSAALQRLRLGMAIRNPLLQQIKAEFPDVFNVTRKAALILQQKIGRPIPPEEVGYLAMHFGAAVIRKMDNEDVRHRVLVVCSSGIGSAKMLGAQMERKISRIKVVDIISILQVEEWITNHSDVDLIVTTIPLPIPNRKTVVVSPLLPDEDISKIETLLQQECKVSDSKVSDEWLVEDTIDKLGRYDQAMNDIIERIRIHQMVEVTSKNELIRYIAVQLSPYSLSEQEQLYDELESREQKGAIVLKEFGLAMLHTRSKATDSMHVEVIQLGQPIPWEDHPPLTGVSTVLVLIAPDKVPLEHFELVSEVSAGLIEEDFVRALTEGTPEEIKNKIRFNIRKGYLEKTKALLRGRL